MELLGKGQAVREEGRRGEVSRAERGPLPPALLKGNHQQTYPAGFVKKEF